MRWRRIVLLRDHPSGLPFPEDVRLVHDPDDLRRALSSTPYTTRRVPRDEVPVDVQVTLQWRDEAHILVKRRWDTVVAWIEEDPNTHTRTCHLVVDTLDSRVAETSVMLDAWQYDADHERAAYDRMIELVDRSWCVPI